jgi:hypothetical protein
VERQVQDTTARTVHILRELIVLQSCHATYPKSMHVLHVLASSIPIQTLSYVRTTCTLHTGIKRYNLLKKAAETRSSTYEYFRDISYAGFIQVRLYCL